MRYHGDTDRARPDSALEPTLQVAPNQVPAHRHEKQKANDVCQHARRHQKCSCNQNQYTVNDRHGGRPALAKILTQAREGVDALLLRQRGSHDAGPDDECQRGDRTDTLADLNEQDQFNRRYDYEEQQEEASHSFDGLLRHCQDRDDLDRPAHERQMRARL